MTCLPNILWRSGAAVRYSVSAARAGLEKHGWNVDCIICWFFGHYHEDMVVEKKYVMLYEQIIRLKL